MTRVAAIPATDASRRAGQRLGGSGRTLRLGAAGRRSGTSDLECRSDGATAARRAVDLGRIEAAVREILIAIGENPERDGLMETPRRVARAYRDLFGGMRDDAARHLSRTFEHQSDELVVVRGIPFSSMCEHHMLPFMGQAHVAYLPGGGRVVGLSKLARTVDVFARRPQMQERLSQQVADALEQHLSPRGACVVMEAEHLCMRLRGACKPEAVTTTMAVRGVYREDIAARAEVLRLMRIGG
ncbi:MAG: GTP cyclohydrolase I FolE [Planctomycetia bacterium]|nr:MAG: GTP cyclohydrolase I FolE [Planctomycetia bacterium]